MDELLNQLKANKNDIESVYKIVAESKLQNVVLNINEFKLRGISSWYSYYIWDMISVPHNYNIIYQIMNDRDLKSYVKYDIINLEFNSIFLSNAINNTYGKMKEFYIDLPLCKLFISYNAVKLTVDLNIYTAHYISKFIIQNTALREDIIYLLLKDNYIKDFTRIYNLSVEYKRHEIVRQLNSYILNQV